MKPSSVFFSHTHRDKPFVRRLGADLAALGARVWIDEAELNIGDSLLGRIAAAIDEMQYLAVVLSPDADRWTEFGCRAGSSDPADFRGRWLNRPSPFSFFATAPIECGRACDEPA